MGVISRRIKSACLQWGEAVFLFKVAQGDESLSILVAGEIIRLTICMRGSMKNATLLSPNRGAAQYDKLRHLSLV